MCGIHEVIGRRKQFSFSDSCPGNRYQLSAEKVRFGAMKFLVPFDFTEVAEVAFDHAQNLAVILGGELDLLHIIKDESEREEVERRFENFLNRVKNKTGKPIEISIRVGDIFKDIAAEAEEDSVDLMVMGTHGMRGWQRVFGSNALRVVKSSGSPFWITQKTGPSSIDEIVLPVELSKESVLIAEFAGWLAKKFNAKVFVVYQEQSDEFLANKIRNNVEFIKMKLRQQGAEFEVESLNPKKAFHDAVVQFGGSVGVDLYAMAHFSESILPQLDRFTQELISNEEEIPVLVINAHEVLNVNSTYSFITI